MAVTQIFGASVRRREDPRLITGRATYTDDVNLPGMLYAAILRSPHAHARIRSIDTSAAEQAPGVLAVVTHADLPTAADRVEELGESAVNVKEVSENIFASQKVLYRGHAVAAVAATSPHLAEEALGLIRVDYEVLPPVLDVLDAMRDDAPLL
ncbi:MAG: oxidoreductase, partial [Chloroflexota bacterium]